MIPITINNNTYTSISAGWRAVSPPGLSLITVRWRLRNNWTPKDALTTPVVPPEDRRMFADNRNNKAPF